MGRLPSPTLFIYKKKFKKKNRKKICKINFTAKVSFDEGSNSPLTDDVDDEVDGPLAQPHSEVEGVGVGHQQPRHQHVPKTKQIVVIAQPAHIRHLGGGG